MDLFGRLPEVVHGLSERPGQVAKFGSPSPVEVEINGASAENAAFQRPIPLFETTVAVSADHLEVVRAAACGRSPYWHAPHARRPKRAETRV